MAAVREAVRRVVWKTGKIVTTKAEIPEGQGLEYRDYFDYSEPVAHIPPHRVLAINRGDKEGPLKVRLEVPRPDLEEATFGQLPLEGHPHAEIFRAAALDALDRLLLPSLEREVRRDLTDLAERHAVDVFARNLRSLLLQPPIPKQVVLAIDPGFRTGCKVAVLDGHGDLLEHGVIHPHPPQNRRHEAKLYLKNLVGKHEVGVVAIGNGTACRETEELVAEIIAEGTHFHQNPVRPRRRARDARGGAPPPPPSPEPEAPAAEAAAARERRRLPRPSRPPPRRARRDRPSRPSPRPSRRRPSPLPPRPRSPPRPRRPRRRSRCCRRSPAGPPTRIRRMPTRRAPPPPSSAGEAASADAESQKSRRARILREHAQSRRRGRRRDLSGGRRLRHRRTSPQAETTPPAPALRATTRRARRRALAPGRAAGRRTRARRRRTPSSPSLATRRPAAHGAAPSAEPRLRAAGRSGATPAPKPPAGGTATAAGRARRRPVLIARPQSEPRGLPGPSSPRARPSRIRPTPCLAQLAYVIVNEAGASVYSASPVGREEFPEFDATLRGTISIGRRLQDPLTELVKIEPQNIGVGLYQHDVNPKQLKESLEAVIESASTSSASTSTRPASRCCATSRA